MPPVQELSKEMYVKYCNINIANENTVEFDDTKTDIEKLKSVIKAGYGIQENKREIILPISGMTCASCVKAVERAIGKLEGVNEVSVNLATEKAKVVYDSSKVRISQIKDVVVKAGYSALDIETGEQADHERERREKEVKTLWKKFILSMIFTTLFIFCHGSNDRSSCT